MVLEITNKKIITFFEQRPDMDIELTILKFIDMMEMLQEHTNKTLTNTTVVEILDNIKSLRNDNQLHISNQIGEIKKGLKDDMKMIMSVCLNENLEPRLQTKLKEQQTHLLDAVCGKFDNLLDNKFSGINEITNNNKDVLSRQNEKLDNLFNKFENSSKKGQISENLLYNSLSTLFPKAEINSVGQTKETGDIMLIRHNKPKILVENKDWTRPVVQSEVTKFIRDIDVQKCSGIFLSQNGAICTKENFEINIHNGFVLVYVHDVNNEIEKIKIAVDIVDSFSLMLKDFEQESKNEMETNTISKEITDYINAEYQTFITRKASTIKKAKDLVQILVKDIENFNLPSLENYLTSKYSSSSNKFVCEYCGFVGKNQQSRSAHMRGCIERKKALSGDNSNNSVEMLIETE
tara:strand:+ start:1257 stop:2474 length:1218 start_codon:yes stop_codon:yes gene_type:complete